MEIDSNTIASTPSQEGQNTSYVPRTEQKSGHDHNTISKPPLINTTPTETNKLRVRLAFAELRPGDEDIMKSISRVIANTRPTKPLEMQPVSSQAVIIQTADPDVFKALLAAAEVTCGGKVGALTNERDPRHVLKIRALPIGATREDVVRAVSEFFHVRNTHRPIVGAFLARYALAFGWTKAAKEVPKSVSIGDQRCPIEIRPFGSEKKPQLKANAADSSTRPRGPWEKQGSSMDSPQALVQEKRATEFPTPAEAANRAPKVGSSEVARRFLTVRSLSPPSERAQGKSKEGIKIRFPARLLKGAKGPEKSADAPEVNKMQPQVAERPESPGNIYPQGDTTLVVSVDRAAVEGGRNSMETSGNLFNSIDDFCNDKSTPDLEMSGDSPDAGQYRNGNEGSEAAPKKAKLPQPITVTHPDEA